VGSDRQTRSEDLVFQIGRDVLSPRRPQRGIATLHAASFKSPSAR
jgi:hypothetical protein